MNFLCPNCGGTRLEEIMSGVTMATNINSVGEGGDVDYGDDSAGDSGSVDRYQCVDCGSHVQDEDENDITDSDALFERLKELEEARCFKISFTAQGHVEQTILITDPHYTPEMVLDMLKKGEAWTTAQEDGKVTVLTVPVPGSIDKSFRQPMKDIATVISSDCHLEYEDFEPREE